MIIIFGNLQIKFQMISMDAVLFRLIHTYQGAQKGFRFFYSFFPLPRFRIKFANNSFYFFSHLWILKKYNVFLP